MAKNSPPRREIEPGGYMFRTKPKRRERDDVEVNAGALRGRTLEQAPVMHRRAAASAPLNREAMTLDATIATDFPVERRDAAGPFLEVLDPNGLQMVAGDVPLLDNHAHSRAASTIGRAFDFRVEGRAVVATLRLSTADDALPIVQRLADGTLTSFSAGYRVRRWIESRDANGRRVRTAAAWSLVEVSIVGIPADPNARRRSGMDPENEDLDTLDTMPPEQADAIRSIGELFDLPPSAAEAEIEAGSTVAEARATLRTRALDERRQRSASTRIRTVNAGPSPDETRAARVEAITCRMTGDKPSDAAQRFMGLRLVDHASDALTAAGVSVRGLSPDDVFTRAGQLTTSDFPMLMGNAMNRVAAQAYEAAQSPLRTLAKQRNLSDFRASTAIRLGELGRLEAMSESGEFRHTSQAEEGESMTLETFGRAINVSRRLLVNDDLNLLGDMNSAFGRAAAETEADLLADLLTGNPKLSDGKAVFHASRGNIGTAAPISIASLNEARKALRTRKGVDGKTPINAPPKYLLVGPELETAAEAILADIDPGTVADQNPFAGKLSLLVEPRLEGLAWFLFADPKRVAALQFGYLSASPGVIVQRTEAFDQLGTRFRAFLDFGCGWLDWRGAQMNAGA